MKIKKSLGQLVFIIGLAASTVFTGLFAPISSDTEDAEIHHLVTPGLAEADIIGRSVRIQAYRKSGIRLDMEQMGTKLIVHDYGHGGSGLALSWGCAEHAVNSMKLELNRLKRQSTKNIAVLGAGVIGLTTAYILLSRGYKVTIYAQDFPNETMSDVAVSWLVDSNLYAEQTAAEQAQFEEMKYVSLLKFRELAMFPEPIVQGAHLSPCYVVGVTSGMLAQQCGALIADIKPVHIIFDTGIERKGLLYQGVVVDNARYMNDLFSKVKAMGAIIKNKTIDSPDALLAVPEKVVCNCLGLGARDVFNDQELYAVIEYRMHLKLSPGTDYVFLEKSMINGHEQTITFWQTPWQAGVSGVLNEQAWALNLVQNVHDHVMHKMHVLVGFPKGRKYS